MTHDLEARLDALANLHRDRGILMDTNVLLLFLFACFKPQMIGRKRLEKYTNDDGELLKRYVQKFGRILTTAHVLTETSNLARQIVDREMRLELMKSFYPLFCLNRSDSFKHCVVEGKTLITWQFVRLGLTDSCLAALVRRRKRLLLTDDLDLYQASVVAGDAINFTHMREAAGLI